MYISLGDGFISDIFSNAKPKNLPFEGCMPLTNNEAEALISSFEHSAMSLSNNFALSYIIALNLQELGKDEIKRSISFDPEGTYYTRHT